MGNYKPTDAVIAPGGDRVFIADGYGSSMIHTLKTADGVYAGKSWGGKGSAHGELDCPHGITYDPRRQLLLVADRGNKRLEYFTLNGLYHSTVEVKELTAPCNADVWGEYVLVPDLNGPVVILDKDNQAISVIEVGSLLGAQGFKHPHDAIWLPNGDVVVCTWNPGRLGYWRRLPVGQ
jgi:DNA-binding beta-propeller fold protein YncE